MKLDEADETDEIDETYGDTETLETECSGDSHWTISDHSVVRSVSTAFMQPFALVSSHPQYNIARSPGFSGVVIHPSLQHPTKTLTRNSSRLGTSPFELRNVPSREVYLSPCLPGVMPFRRYRSKQWSRLIIGYQAGKGNHAHNRRDSLRNG